MPPAYEVPFSQVSIRTNGGGGDTPSQVRTGGTNVPHSQVWTGGCAPFLGLDREVCPIPGSGQRGVPHSWVWTGEGVPHPMSGYWGGPRSGWGVPRIHVSSQVKTGRGVSLSRSDPRPGWDTPYPGLDGGTPINCLFPCPGLHEVSPSRTGWGSPPPSRSGWGTPADISRPSSIASTCYAVHTGILSCLQMF